MYKPFYFIFVYDHKGVTSKVLSFDDLKDMIHQVGWVRGKKYKVMIVDAIEPSSFKVIELNDDLTAKPYGEELIINFKQFYQGGRLDR